ncbi:MAG: DUF302 domain-containing protein [Gammaproteobacteria bacterium]
MGINFRRLSVPLSWLVMVVCFSASTVATAADQNPAFWKYHVKGDFATVLEHLKGGLEADQFSITGEENLAKGLENNKQVFGTDQWNTIGFDQATAVHFCSLVFNQEVFNITMDWSILCPFKVVMYTMKAAPNDITLVMVRPTYVLKNDPHPKAKEIADKIEARIVNAIEAAVGPGK